MHLVAGGGAAQVGGARTGHAAMRRIGMVQWRQDAGLGQDGGVVFGLVGVEQLGLALQPGAALQRQQGQFAHGRHLVQRLDMAAVDDAYAALALAVAVLNQPHRVSLSVRNVGSGQPGSDTAWTIRHSQAAGVPRYDGSVLPTSPELFSRIALAGR